MCLVHVREDNDAHPPLTQSHYRIGTKHIIKRRVDQVTLIPILREQEPK